MNTVKKIVNIYKPLCLFFAVGLFILTLSRMLLVMWLGDRVSTDSLAPIFLGGLRMDVVVLCLWLIPAAFLPLWNGQHVFFDGVKWFTSVWLTLGFSYIVFLEVATPSFILEYDLRPNRLFIEYLNSPYEVTGMLVAGYPWLVIVAVLSLSISIFIGWKLFKIKPGNSHGLNMLGVSSLCFLMVIILAFGVRSGFQNRPVNPSSVSFSSDPLLNMLPLSSGYNVLYSMYRLGNEKSTHDLYPEIAVDKMLKIVLGDKKKYQSKKTLKNNNLNLVIIIEESLGAQFVKELGGIELTPNLDKLKQESWWFENAYATGTRSARGLEAIITGFPPSPARSVLKLPKAQSNFFTLAKLLKTQGYTSSFIYGGESHFDNMRGFFLNNGFDQAIDEKDYDAPGFVGNWGVSDEDLFNKAHEKFENHSGSPFFSVVFSSSNHSPWQFPDGKIELYDDDKNTRNNAVKYADYALDNYIEKAKKSNYWHNTIFVIVADHDSRVHGEDLVPVDRFHIPALILGKPVSARIDKRIISQIDLGPTLLSMLGINKPTPMIGRDLTQNISASGRAIMQYGDNQAYMEDNKVVILQPGKQVQQFTRVKGKLVASRMDTRLADKAKAHAAWVDHMYYNELYSLIN